MKNPTSMKTSATASRPPLPLFVSVGSPPVLALAVGNPADALTGCQNPPATGPRPGPDQTGSNRFKADKAISGGGLKSWPILPVRSGPTMAERTVALRSEEGSNTLAALGRFCHRLSLRFNLTGSRWFALVRTGWNPKCLPSTRTRGPSGRQRRTQTHARNRAPLLWRIGCPPILFSLVRVAETA
jgi:hypothetical protein